MAWSPVRLGTEGLLGKWARAAKVAPAAEHTPAPGWIRAKSEAAVLDGFASVPGNQPSVRFAGHPDAPLRPLDQPEWMGGPLVKQGTIISPDPSIPWMSRSTFNASPIVKDGQLYTLFRAEDMTGDGKWFGTSRIGLARKTADGSWEIREQPVLGPTEWYESLGGLEDPRVVQIGDKYLLTYTGYRYEDQTARLAWAVSDDLIHWEKKGLMLPKWRNPEEEKPQWSKSGAIVPQKVNGEYLMYFGDKSMWLARSKDLEHWTVDPEPVVKARPGFWDGIMVEPGSAWVDKKGIHLVYNGDAPPHGYAAGELVFSTKNPTEVLRRSDGPMIRVDQDWEKQGQVGNVIFVGGMAFHKGDAYVLYGAADDKIALAVAPLSSGKKPYAKLAAAAGLGTAAVVGGHHLLQREEPAAPVPADPAKSEPTALWS